MSARPNGAVTCPIKLALSLVPGRQRHPIQGGHGGIDGRVGGAGVGGRAVPGRVGGFGGQNLLHQRGNGRLLGGRGG